jgi:TDG/mug DNA glycosylase family protein
VPRRGPSKQELAAARGRTIPAVLGPGLRVLFVGINPGLWSGATGHHFARPGNRFWPALHASGFTDRRLDPSEDVLLPGYGLGVTNLVTRTTATAAELDDDELRAGAANLDATVRVHRPRAVAILGIGAYRTGFGRRRAPLGEQDERIGASSLWVVPNPSGLNASYPLPEIVRWFVRLREATA